MNKLIPVGICLLFVGVGVAAIGLGVREMALAQAAIDWPTADAVVVTSQMSRDADDDGVTYRPAIEYEFHIGETLYSGGNVTFSQLGTSNPANARRVLNKYPEGAAVVVHYDPNDPYRSVLEPGITFSSWFKPLFGVAFSGLGLIGILAVLLAKS